LRGGAHARLAGSTEREKTMPRSWSDKRERQYEHIKESYEERGRSEDKAEELAARTVNKERSESGEAKSGSRKR
jgi:plasmid stabilization system protein ParE